MNANSIKAKMGENGKGGTFAKQTITCMMTQMHRSRKLGSNMVNVGQSSSLVSV